MITLRRRFLTPWYMLDEDKTFAIDMKSFEGLTQNFSFTFLERKKK